MIAFAHNAWRRRDAAPPALDSLTPAPQSPRRIALAVGSSLAALAISGLLILVTAGNDKDVRTPHWTPSTRADALHLLRAGSLSALPTADSSQFTNITCVPDAPLGSRICRFTTVPPHAAWELVVRIGDTANAATTSRACWLLRRIRSVTLRLPVENPPQVCIPITLDVSATPAPTS
jgi:hypothetical protein